MRTMMDDGVISQMDEQTNEMVKRTRVRPRHDSGGTTSPSTSSTSIDDSVDSITRRRRTTGQQMSKTRGTNQRRNKCLFMLMLGLFPLVVDSRNHRLLAFAPPTFPRPAAFSSGRRPFPQHPPQQQYYLQPPTASSSVGEESNYDRLVVATFDSFPTTGTSTMTTTLEEDDDDDENNAPLVYEADPNDQRYSASDWLQNMKSLPRSTILRSIQFPVLSIMLWSTFVSVVYCVLGRVSGPAAAARLAIDSKPHSFLVSALGLLLVFRTNSAYGKFAEGRKIWEVILSLSRNMTRMALLYETELGVARRKRVFRLLASFPYLLFHHIQPQCDATLANSTHGLAVQRSEPLIRSGRRRHYVPMDNKAASDSSSTSTSNSCCWVDKKKVPWCLFPESVQQLVAQSTNRPLWVCDRLGQEINQVMYTPNFTSRERLTFLSQIDKLSQCIGECERIHQTAVPLNYARHSLRSLTLWLLTLPFALVQEFGLLTGPVMGLGAWLLYGIYQIGYQIEDPFQGSLRLSILCDAIYRDVMDFMKRRTTAFSEMAKEELDAWSLLDDLQASSPQEASTI